MANFVEFSGAAALNQNLSGKMADALRQGIAERGQATLIVSGGRTPLELFRHLSRQELDWSRVTITLADERWVTRDHGSSNEKMVRNSLLQGEVAKATFIALKNAATTAAEGEAQTEEALAALFLPADVTLLGMGDDGHIASLFPGSANLPQAMDLQSTRRCVAITPITAPLERMTLTLPVILDSRRIYLLLAGEAKREVYERAEKGTDQNDMPVRAVLNQQQTPVEVYWTA
ncbi:6-phosphogluconolactonase [Rouxiella chamberiensis]|uniref:6-phosphogluconolactonase n=1 Tax=Rouxiella chamberiensis TaxID=1513468 RepID=A0ABY7HSL5_9GAMM|nr:6-phosphogluconolactonase [Rouxiella chamberiensis]WAT01977.1 6-phosphogluconolactonase [Rouxiella chamberiensis]